MVGHKEIRIKKLGPRCENSILRVVEVRGGVILFVSSFENVRHVVEHRWEGGGFKLEVIKLHSKGGWFWVMEVKIGEYVKGKDRVG